MSCLVNKEWFEEHEYLPTQEQARILGVPITTLRLWRRRLGISSGIKPKPGKPKQAKPIELISREIWENKEWLKEHYINKRLGSAIIGRMTGISRTAIIYHLRKYGIKIRTREESLRSRNKCCSGNWLMENYADRESYLRYCQEEEIKPKPDGGKRLSIGKCAELAGVSSKYTISNWLTKFGIQIRNPSEAIAGDYNGRYGETDSPEVRAISSRSIIAVNEMRRKKTKDRLAL